jgi:hypothetical protein
MQRTTTTGEVVPISKERNLRPVPSAWRTTLSKIVEAFKDGDFILAQPIPGVRSISKEDAAGIADSIEDYGAQLTSLPEDTWKTSICQWLESHWDVMVDLYAVDEGASNLILHVHVYEDGPSFAFEVHFVYAP